MWIRGIGSDLSFTKKIISLRRELISTVIIKSSSRFILAETTYNMKQTTETTKDIMTTLRTRTTVSEATTNTENG